MLKIVKAPDPLLNQVSEPCQPGDPDLAGLAEEMAELMYATDGIGLAAPQVGILKRIIVVDCGEEYGDAHMALVNPEILEKAGEPETAEEGCLSCPGIYVEITRQPWVKVSYYDLEGKKWVVESDGLFGRCLQHEVDHLNGITLFESAAPKARRKALKEYAQIQDQEERKVR